MSGGRGSLSALFISNICSMTKAESVKAFVFVIVNTVSLTVGHTVFIIYYIIFIFRVTYHTKQITPCRRTAIFCGKSKNDNACVWHLSSGQMTV